MDTLKKYKAKLGKVKEPLVARLPFAVAGIALAFMGTVAAIGLGRQPILGAVDTGTGIATPPDLGQETTPVDPGTPRNGDGDGGVLPINLWDLLEAYEVTNQSPSSPGSGSFLESFKTQVGTEDHSYLTTAISNVDGGWDGQVFKFSVPSTEWVGRITVHWVGYGEASEGYPIALELYNRLTNSWELRKEVQTSTLGQNVTLDLDLVGSYSSYIDGEGSMWVRVFAYNQELATPTNLVAAAAASNEVRLSWSDNASTETGYQVMRRPAADPNWTTIATLASNATAYTDYDASRTTLTPGSKYYYAVAATAGGAQSEKATSLQLQLPAKGKRTSSSITVPGDASTIQEALNLAVGSDTVKVLAGTYAEAVVMRTPKVTLSGVGVNATTIAVPSSCAGQYCSAITVETNSAQTVTVEDLATTDGRGTLVEGVRYGGGVLVQKSAADLRRLKLFRSTVAGPGSMGSAVALLSPDVVTIDNVAAMLNLADGPVVYVDGANSGLVLKHVTLSGNGSSGQKPAAGLWVQDSTGSVDVVNSILWNNTAGLPEAARDGKGTPIRISNSVVGPVTSLGTPISSLQWPQLIGCLNADPKLTSYEDPHLLASSPAIDFGLNEGGTAYDYESVARPQGTKYDSGASEYATSKSGGKTSSLPPRPLAVARPETRPHASLNTDLIELQLEPATPPAAPSYLRIASYTEDRISVRFQDNATDEDGFIVHRTQGDLEVALAPIAAHVGTGDVLFPDYGADLPSGRLAPGTEYCYYVSAYRGGAYADSPQVCQATAGTAGSPPNAPSNVAVTGISAGQMHLTWNDNSGGSNPEDGFAIYRKRQGSGQDFSLVSPPAVANATSYVDSGGDTDEGVLQSGATYCYRVAAYNEHGLSTAMPTGPDGACAATPLQTWVEVFQGSGDGTRSPGPADLGERSDFQFQGENDDVELETRLAELLGSDQAYNWQVFAVHLDTPPQGLTSLTLRWRGRGDDQPNYPVRFSIYNFVTNSWVHQPVFPGGQIEGEVRPGQGIIRNSAFSFNLTSQQLAAGFSGTASGYANTVLLWVRARAYIPVPTQPEGLRAEPQPAPTTVSLAWDDRSTDETGFEVQRAPIPAGMLPVEPSWSTMRTTAANVTSYTEAVPVASSFQYRVRAVRGAIGSEFVGPLRVDTPLYAPYLPSVVAVGSSSIRVNWQMNPANGSKFPASSYATEVYRLRGMPPSPIEWQLVGTATAGATTFLDSGLLPDTTYSYYVRFSVPDGAVTRYSVASESIYTKTTAVSVPPAPEDLVATPVSTSQINLAWKDVAGEVGYVLERQVGLTGTWQTIDSNIPADTVDYGDVALAAGQLYQYRLRAKNEAGFSSYSNVATATTFPPAGDSWQVIAQLPNRNGLVQGATVLAAHGSYLYAASNDADNQGKEGWFHLNVWRSGTGSSWTWVGQTATDVPGNVPVAMSSYNGKLFLLTGSRLWSSGDGSSWVQVLGQGVGDAESRGHFSHLTVWNGKLFVLLQDGSVFYTGDGATWYQSVAAPANVRALAQQGGQLLAAAVLPPSGGVSRLAVYRSYDGDTWAQIGQVLGQDGYGVCDGYGGLLGLGTGIYAGAANAAGQPCLWRSADGGSSWLRTGGIVNLWAALPDATGSYVATTASYPEPVAARIASASGDVNVVGTVGLGIGYRIWSFASFSGKRYAAAFPPAGVNPTVPDPALIMELLAS